MMVEHDEEFLGLSYEKINKIFDILYQKFSDYFDSEKGEFIFEVEDWLRNKWLNSFYIKPNIVINEDEIEIIKNKTDILLTEKIFTYKEFLNAFSEDRMTLPYKGKYFDQYKDMIEESRNSFLRKICHQENFYFKRKGNLLPFIDGIIMGRNIFYNRENMKTYEKHNKFLDDISLEGEVLSKWYPIEDIIGELVDNSILKELSKFELE